MEGLWAWSCDLQHLSYSKPVNHLSFTAEHRARTISYIGNRNSQARSRTCEAGKGAITVAVAEPLWDVGSWDTAFLTDEAPWLVQVRPPTQAALSSCLGLGKPESVCSLPCGGGRARQGGKGAWLRPFEFSEVRFVFCLRFLLDVLVRRVWVVTGGAGFRAGLGSLGLDCPHCTAALGSFLVGMAVPWQTETRWNTLSTGQPFPVPSCQW